MRFLFVMSVVLVMVTSQMGKRRRVKKKIVKQDVSEGGIETGDENLIEQHRKDNEKLMEQHRKDNEDKPKEGRGFLDEYYSQFERTEVAQRQKQDLQERHQQQQQQQQQRQQKQGHQQQGHRQGDQLTAESVARGFNTNQFHSPSNTVAPADRREETGEETQLSQNQLSQLVLKEQQLQELLARESELTPAQREQLLRQLSQWPGQQHVQQLPALPDDDSYLYGSNLMQDLTENELVDADRHDLGPQHSHQTPYSQYLSEVIPASLTDAYRDDTRSYEESMEEDLLDREYQGQYKESGSVSSATKYIGLTGTTSQDIQLGLTFTVPFLSIPLNAINSIIGGNFGDIGNLLNFDNLDFGSLATIAVIGIAAIFVLPQVLYWLTGVNLSSFNWGRSDEAGGALGGMVQLANTVDTALSEFNIDGKGCMARSLCTTLYDEDKKSDIMIVNQIAKAAIGNPNMSEFLGDQRISMLKEYGKIYDKYGSYPKSVGSPSCDTVFRSSTCPWDTKGITSIVMKLMASQGTSLADIALKAAAAAAKS